MPLPPPLQLTGPELCVVHADEALLVLDKPCGLLSVPGRGPELQDCLSARAQAHFSDARIVHRLDMATSGLLLMARGAAMQRRLSQDFEARSVHKRYVAVVAGELTQPAAADDEGWGRIDLPIAADWPRRPLRVIDPVHGKPSITRWRLIGVPGKRPGTTRVALEPVTGRTHQLRVHLQAIGHPILGDALYGDAAVQAASTRLLLHASELRFRHPLTGEALLFESEPPF